MSREIPEPVRAAAGLAATVLDEARRLPRTLPALPVRVLGLALQATMKLQQHWSGLVARGDEVFTGLRGAEEPGLATFDEDLPPVTPVDGTRDSAFDRAVTLVPDDEDAVAEEVAALVDDEVSGLPPEAPVEELVESLADITDQVTAADDLDVAAPEPGLSTEDALETALLEADGAADAALVQGGDAGADLAAAEEIAEAPEEFADAPEQASGTTAEASEAPAPSDPGGSPVGEDAGTPDVQQPDAGAPAPAEPEEGGELAGAPAAGAAPIDGYDGFTIAQLRGRLRGYQLSTVQELLAYEEATRAREPFLRMLRNRLEKLERQAVESSPLAPRGA